MTYAPTVLYDGPPETAEVTLRSNAIGQWDYQMQGVYAETAAVELFMGFLLAWGRALQCVLMGSEYPTTKGSTCSGLPEKLIIDNM